MSGPAPVTSFGFYALDVGLVFATAQLLRLMAALYNYPDCFYALDVGLVFATNRVAVGSPLRGRFYALDVGLVFATDAF